MHDFTTRLYFRCPACDASDTIDVEVAEFTGGAAATSEGPVVVECIHCEHHFDGQASCDAASSTIILDEFPNIVFYGDAPAYSSFDEDYWYDYAPPENPYGSFLETRYQIVEMLNQQFKNIDDPQLMNRMIFSQLISTMESYLADTLIYYVFQDSNRILKLVSSDKNLIQERFSIIQVMRSENVVETTVRRYLRSVLYHNLERVRFLYRSALQIEISPSDQMWKVLLSAINHRHDCVHRNGITVDGERNRIFTKTYVRRIAQIIESLARSVQHQVNKIDLDIPL